MTPGSGSSQSGIKPIIFDHVKGKVIVVNTSPGWQRWHDLVGAQVKR